jgi:farnesyl-diphosphate farnesyltransferase
MTIPDEKKQSLLRSFHEKTITPGWNFDGNGPNEKDRQLLVEYNVVIEELLLLDPAEREVIVDICYRMETGMADYAHAAATSGHIYLEKVEEYDLYCHYVAGLVGEGLSRLLAASGKEKPGIADQLELSNSMGLMLQKTNIIRDFREDANERRFFWPRKMWGRDDLGGPAFKEMTEMHAPGREQQALWVLSAMVVDALRHAEDCLDYLKLLRNQTVFNFCAIPQVMAIATLELVFMNPAVFQRNVKIRKALAAEVHPFSSLFELVRLMYASIADHEGDKPS